MNKNKVIASLRSFTMIEMMVVAAIAVTLCILAFGMIQSYLSRAERISCLNNLRQVMIGIHAYAADHYGMLPQQAIYTGDFEPDWSGRLTNGYVSSSTIFKCPTDKNLRRAEFDGRPWRSYAANGQMTNWAWGVTWGSPYKWPWPTPEEAPKRIWEIPPHVILIGENHGIDGGTPSGLSGAVVGVSEMESMQGHASAMHRDIGPSGAVASTDIENGGGNYAYIDGRVEFHYRSEFKNPNGSFDGNSGDPWKWR